MVAAAGIRSDWRQRITPEDCRQYAQDGVVYLPKLIDPEWLLLIDLGIQRILASGSPDIQTFFKGLPGEFKDMVRHFDSTPEF